MRPIPPRRDGHLALAAVSGMAILGATAIVAVDPVETLHEDPFVVLTVIGICSLVGAAIGLFSIPIVTSCLRRKDLRLAIPVVYGSSFLVVVLFVRAGPNFFEPPLYTWPIHAAIPAFLTVSLASFFAYLALPNRFQAAPFDRCPACGYDLQASAGIYCPECGWCKPDGPSGVA